MFVYVCFVKTLVLVVVTDVFLSSGASRDNEVEGGRGFFQKDSIAEEWGREEAVDTIEVGGSPSGAGGEESLEVARREAGLDVFDGRDDHVDGVDG